MVDLVIRTGAVRRAPGGRITVVLPYCGYARADRKTEPRVPISSKLMANLITISGANRVITVDLHAAQIQGFFDIPLDHLFAAPVFLEYLKGKNLNNLTVGSPELGRVVR